MTIPLWCLAAGCLLPYFLAGLSVPFRSKQFGKPDLDEPRVQGDELTATGGRVWAAQANAWEALIVFAVANLIASVQGLEPNGSWSTAALVWLVARILHALFYTAGQTVLRILSFAVGFAMSAWIIFQAAGA